MRIRRILAIALLPSAALAQQGAVCASLLDHGIANVVSYTSEYDFLTVIKDNYCSESWSSMSKSRQDAFESTIKKVPVKYSGASSKASEQHSQFCREYGAVQSVEGKTRYSAASLYDKAIEAWRDCVALSLGGTEIKPSVTPDQKVVDFSLSISRGAATFTGVDATNMECRMDGRKIEDTASVPLLSLVKSLRCERSGRTLEFNSSAVQYFPAANVKVKTTTGDFRVDLYEMIDGPVQGRLALLEAQLASLYDVATKTATEVGQLGSDRTGTVLRIANPVMRDGKPHECPAGTFVSMVQASKGVGGKYAVDGISEIIVRCTPIHLTKKH